MNKTKIEWADYTWNPVIGCKHNCSYCYARKINDRFKMIPDWTKPQFFPKRLLEPGKVKNPSTIFVGSMCDLFGEWVDKRWVHLVIDWCEDSPHHKFMFLTKNPKRYSEFKFPENCWLGITLTKYNDLNTDVLEFTKNNKNKLFISIEPLLGEFCGCPFIGIDLIIVGAMTGPGAIPPKREWIDSIKHHNIFYKDNIKRYMK